MRWRLRLAEYDFEVLYKKGKSNTQADALSRLKTLVETIIDDADEIPTFITEEESFTISDLTQEDIEQAISIIDDEDNEIDENDLDDQHADELLIALPDIQQTDPIFNLSPKKS